MLDIISQKKSGIISEDEYFMRRAITIAKRACGWTSPNPLVGAVLVKDGCIIGEGYHEYFGGLHAERNAIKNCVGDLSGSTLYVTLEPCCHYGKTPPCTDIIIESKVKRVVLGSSDPNPLVSGKGIEILRENGIEVVEGFLREECDRLNLFFFSHILRQRPYVMLKYAMSMDGKICTHTNKSRWITGEYSRGLVHIDRHRYAAIMVGVNTVLQDDPMLDSRYECISKVLDESECESIGIKKDGDNIVTSSPIRIICDTKLRTPLDCKIVTTAKNYRTIIATCSKDESLIRKYIQAGCEIILQDGEDSIDLKKLVDSLYLYGIDSLMIEGGSMISWSSLESGIVDYVKGYISPKILGGSAVKTPVAGIGVNDPNRAYMLKNMKISTAGEDIILEGDVDYCLQE